MIGHLYRITWADGTHDATVDEVLDRIEHAASQTIQRLADGPCAAHLDAFDHFRLVQFVISLANRTPRALEAHADMDGEIQALEALERLGDREHIHRVMHQQGERDEEAIERMRREAIQDIDSGRIGFEAQPERALASLVYSLTAPAEQLFTELSGVVLRIPEDSPASFVVSDHPVAHLDPAPKAPEAGAGFASSPQSMTWLPLGAHFGLLFLQRHPGRWSEREATLDQVRHLNLLEYAWAKHAIYGRSQAAVTGVRALAKQHPAWLHRYRYRPPRLWIAEGKEGERGGATTFTSRTPRGTVTMRLDVPKAAYGTHPLFTIDA